jgi:PAS domain S-box-containing protein
MELQDKSRQELIDEIEMLRNTIARLQSDTHEHETRNVTDDRLQTLIKSINEAIYEIDKDGTVLYISPTITKITGFRPDEITGRKLYELLGETQVFFKKRVELLIEHKTHSREVLVKDKYGIAKWIRFSTNAIFENGEYTGATGTMVDVTDKKLMEIELQRSEALYSSILNVSPDAIILTDMSGYINYISPSVYKIYRSDKAEDYLGRYVFDFMKPDERQRAMLNTRLRLQGQHVGIMEYTGIRLDGSEFIFDVDSEIIRDRSGNPESILYIIRDITERKNTEKALRESEQKYRNIFETVQDAYYEATIDGILLEISPSIRNISRGIFTREEYIGQSFLRFYADINERTQLQQELFSKGKVVDYEITFCKDNIIIPVSVSTTLQCDSEGNPSKIIGSIRDISSRKEAEKQLHESEERYRAFFEKNKSIILIIDTETGNLKDANDAAAEYYGWTKEELCKMNISQINMLSEEEIREKMDQTKLSNSKLHYFKHRLKDGSIRDVEVYAGPMEFDNHVHLYSIIHDITERKQFEEKLKDSEARFRMIFDNVFDGICIIEENPDPAKRKLIDCNEQYAAMAGRSKKELLETGYIYALTKPIDSNTNKSRIKGLAEQTAYHGSFKWLRPDGHDNLIQYIARPINWEGKSYSIGIDRDITEYKQRETQLRKLSQVVEQSPVSIVISNTEGDIEYANPKACETTGYSQEELLGKNPRILQSGEMPKDDYIKLWKEITSGKVWHGTFHNKRKNGEFYWEASTIAPIFDASGEITNYVAIKEDISDKKKAEEELLKFRTISDMATYGSSITSLNGTVLYLNDAFAEMHQLNKNEVIGKDISVFHNEDQLKRVSELLEQLKTTGKFSAEEVWHVRSDGSVFPTLMNGVLIYDEKNQPAFFSATATDITDIKNAEKKLRESEYNLNHAQELALMGSWKLNLITGESIWSANQYRLLGLEPFCNIDKDTYFESHIHPDDKWIIEPENLKIRDNEIVDGKTSFRFMMPNGSIKWIWNSVVPVIEDGKLVALNGTHVDITTQKLAEEALKQSESDLNFAQQIAKMGSWKLSLTTGEASWSENEYRLWGLQPFEDIDIRSYFSSHIHPDDAHLQDDIYRRIMSEKKDVSAQFRFIMPDNSIKWIQGDVSPIIVDDKIVSMIGTHLDITENKKTNEQLSILSLAVTQSPVGVVITDTNGYVEFVNPAFEKMSGYALKDIIGQNTRILKSGKNTVDVYKNLWETITSGMPWETEWINKRKNGEYYWESISITPIVNEVGEITNYLAVKQDVSERREFEDKILNLNNSLEQKVEERTAQLEKSNDALSTEILERKRIEKELAKREFQYRSVVENIHEIIFQTDMDARLVFLNKSWEVITGFSIDESLGRQTFDFVASDNRQHNVNLFNTLISGQKEYVRDEIIFVAKNGSHLLFEVFGRIAYNPQNQITGVYGSLRDITEEKKAAQEIMKARNEAEKANLAKSEFLSRMSHELRTPMNSILGFAQLLEMGDLTQSQKKGVNHILHSGKHLLNLINEVLDISRIESGRLSISLEPIHLKPVLIEMVDVLQPLAIANSVNLSFDYIEDDSIYIVCDQQSLKQMLLNLLNNAIKYNKPGGYVNVSAYIKDNKKDIRIKITDSGIGIAASDLEKLYVPFERIGAEKTQVEGTGLGLAVVKKLVEATGGQIGVESIPGEGSTFWIEFRLTENQMNALKVNQLVNNNIIEAEHTGKILYIEDNRSNVELMEQILSSQRPGINLYTETSGKAGLERAGQILPDLILLDLNLPDMHGREIKKILSADASLCDIPVVVVSADAMEKQVQELLRLGAKTYITKPLDLNTLLDVIDKFVTSKNK